MKKRSQFLKIGFYVLMIGVMGVIPQAFADDTSVIPDSTVLYIGHYITDSSSKVQSVTHNSTLMDVVSVGETSNVMRTMTVNTTPGNERVYWLDYSNNLIQSTTLTGSGGVTTLYTPGGGENVESVTYSGGKVYWASQEGSGHYVRSADVSGGSLVNTQILRTFSAAGYTQPLDIAVRDGYLYVVMHDNSNNEEFSRSYLDGSNIEQLLEITSGASYSVYSLDVSSSKMFWVQDDGLVRMADNDETDVGNAVTLRNAGALTAVDVAYDPLFDDLYIADYAGQKIVQASGGSYNSFTDVVTGINDGPFTLTVLNPELPPGMMGILGSFLSWVVFTLRRKIKVL